MAQHIQIREAAQEKFCDETGFTISRGDLYWHIYELGTGEPKSIHAAQDPGFSDDYVKRAVLTRASKANLVKLAFARGIHAGHGERVKVHYAKKPELVQMIMDNWFGSVDVPDLTQQTDTQSIVDAMSEQEVRTLVAELFESQKHNLTKLVPNLVLEEMKKRKPNIVVIQRSPKGKKRKLGLQHAQFRTLLDYLSANLSVYLVGPAGSGKTKAASAVADALGLEFYGESVCQQSPASLLKGYMDMKGKYVITEMRKAFENGGVFLLDEMDAGNPNVITVLNAAVAADAGDKVSFPDGMIAKHEDFLCIAAANTFGRGGDREYVGRNPLDAATLDRFVVLEWNYDEDLERAICEAKGYDLKWMEHVQAIRKAVGELKIRLVISPRASFHGGMALAVGRSWSECENTVVYKGLENTQREKIERKVQEYSY